jgi:Fe-S cluster biogenesis protein NfuA
MPKIAEIEDTPNPNALKFTLREPLTYGVSRSYNSAEAAQDDEVASQLFAIAHVINVFYVDRWLTVTQDGQADWKQLVREIAVPLRAAPAASAQSAAAMEAARESFDHLSERDQARLEQINVMLDEQVRPYLQGDGGDLNILGLDGNQLIVQYHGACGTCPSSISGTLRGIENLLRTLEPDIEVIAA